MPKVICGLSGLEFASVEEYREHVSPVTGYKPTDPRHHGSRFLRQQKEALRRGNSMTKEVESEIDSQISEVRDNGTDRKLSNARNT